MYKLSKTSLSRLEGVHPLLVKTIKSAIDSSPHDFGIPPYGGLRTTQDQQKLYAIGRTTELERKPVTYVDGVNKKSNHQAKADGYGHAVDIYIYDHNTNSASWDVSLLTHVAKHIQEVAKTLGLELAWGGDWKWKDYPHLEIKKINRHEIEKHTR